jgi:hypothetical protein
VAGQFLFSIGAAASGGPNRSEASLLKTLAYAVFMYGSKMTISSLRRRGHIRRMVEPRASPSMQRVGALASAG